MAWRRLQWFGLVRREPEEGVLEIVEGMGGSGKEASEKTEKNMEDSAAELKRC